MRQTTLRKRWILWDWGGVCCVAGEHFSNTRMLERCGLTADEMSEKCRDLEVLLYRGQLDGEGFWNAVKTRFPLADFSFEELHQSYLESYRIYDEVFSYIRNCPSTISHALLSNLGEDMSSHIVEKHQLKEFFKHRIFSHEIGLMKPDPKVFTVALQMIDARPEDCLFIDDAPANIEAGNRTGIRSILFTNTRATLSALASALKEQ